MDLIRKKLGLEPERKVTEVGSCPNDVIVHRVETESVELDELSLSKVSKWIGSTDYDAGPHADTAARKKTREVARAKAGLSSDKAKVPATEAVIAELSDTTKASYRTKAKFSNALDHANIKHDTKQRAAGVDKTDTDHEFRQKALDKSTDRVRRRDRGLKLSEEVRLRMSGR